MNKDSLAPAVSKPKAGLYEKERILLKPDDFSVYYRKHFDAVYRYLYSRLGNAQDAEDVCSQTFLQAFHAFASLRDAERFAPWVFTIARNKLNDHWRRKKPVYPLDSEFLDTLSPDLLTQTEKSLRLDKLARQVKGLPEKDQELIRLRYLAELSFNEIAQVLGKSEGAVKKSLYRLLAQLQSQME